MKTLDVTDIEDIRRKKLLHSVHELSGAALAFSIAASAGEHITPPNAIKVIQKAMVEGRQLAEALQRATPDPHPSAPAGVKHKHTFSKDLSRIFLEQLPKIAHDCAAANISMPSRDWKRLVAISESLKQNIGEIEVVVVEHVQNEINALYSSPAQQSQ